MSNEQKRHVLGVGQLSWGCGERITDRYGTVMLFADATPTGSRESLALETGGLTEKRGRLVATVLETRESHHIGDVFHGFVPGGAEKGKDYPLTASAGILFEEHVDGHAAGVRPSDDRETFWLDPKVLYKLHEQTIRLVFLEDDK